MSSDLVKLLKESADYTLSWEEYNLMLEAAQRIEDLEAELDDKVYISEITITDVSNARVFLSNGCELVGLTRIACDVKLDGIKSFQIGGYICPVKQAYETVEKNDD